jgi:competence ComEA-like helix-hairpin-helix protein
MTWIDMTRRERRGILILLTMILIIQLTPLTYSWLQSNEPQFDKADSLIIFRFVREYQDSLKALANHSRRRQQITVRFPFDPNTLSQDSLILLGFSSYAASNLVKYRHNRRPFQKAEDLLRIYGVDSTLYLHIKDLVTILPVPKPQPAQPAPSFTSNKKSSAKREYVPRAIQKSDTLININTADSSALVRLKGIGPVFASRIIKYRQLLGGYHSTEQLREVYGMKEETVSRLKPQLIAKGPLKLLNPRTSTFRDIFRHPYTDYDMTRLIKNNANLPVDSLRLLLIDRTMHKRLNDLWPYLDIPDSTQHEKSNTAKT